jgi:hypothetical protein
MKTGFEQYLGSSLSSSFHHTFFKVFYVLKLYVTVFISHFFHFCSLSHSISLFLFILFSFFTFFFLTKKKNYRHPDSKQYTGDWSLKS